MKNNGIIKLIFLFYIIIGLVFLFFPVIQNKIATDTYVAVSLHDLYQTEKIYESNEIIQFIHPLINPTASLKYYLYLLVSETKALNIYAILLFALAGLGTYMTANWFIKNNFYSFIAGFAYAVLSLYFLQVELVALIPFLTFFLIRFYYSPNKLNFVFLLLTLIFVFNLPLEDIAFITLFIAIFIGYYVFKNWRKWNKRFVFSILVIFVILVSSIIFRYYFSKSSSNTVDLQQLSSSSVELTSSLMPFQHLFFENTKSGMPFLSKVDFNTVNIYLGLLPLIFIIVALASKRDVELTSFLKINAICFFLFSLGPFLKIGNLVKSLIPLPYLFLYRFVPLFDQLKDIKKLYILAYFPMTILLVMGLMAFFNRLKPRKTSKVILAVTIGIFAVELSYFPQGELLFKPNFIKDLASSQEKYSIIYVYSGSSDKNNLVNTYITETNLPNKKIFSAPVENQDDKELVYNRLLNFNIARKKQEEKLFITTKAKHEIYYRWDRDNVRYIILNKNELELQLLDNLKEIIEELKLKKYTEEDGLVVYEIKADPPRLTVIPGKGWTADFETDLNGSYNWQPKSAWSSWESTIDIINSSNKEKNLLLESFVKSDDHRFLTVSRDGEKIKEFFIGPENQGFRIYLDHIKVGKTTISFSTPKRYLSDQMGADPKINFFEFYYEEINDLEIPKIYQRIYNQPGEFKIWQTPLQNSFNYTNSAPKEIFSYDNFLDLVELTNDPVAIRNMDINRVNLCAFRPFFTKGVDFDFVEKNFDIFNRDSTEACGETIFSRYNIKYLILEKKYSIEIGLEYYKAYIRNTFPSAIVDWEDNDYLVHKILNPPTPPSILVNLGEGFGNLISDQKVQKNSLVKEPHREVYSGATIELLNISPNPIVKKIKFSLRSSVNDTKVKLLLNEKEVGNFTLPSEIQVSDLFSLDLKPGINYLTFQIENDYSKPNLYISQFEY